MVDGIANPSPDLTKLSNGITRPTEVSDQCPVLQKVSGLLFIGQLPVAAFQPKVVKKGRSI
jgi:hypothetical protein